MNPTPRNLRATAVLLLALPILGGCPTTGTHGALYFSDRTARHDATVDDPLAVGARMVIEVGCGSCLDADSIDAAQSLDPDQLEVIGFSGREVTVRALAPGAALIEVVIAGVVDTLPLAIEEMDHVEFAPLAFTRLADFPQVTLASGGFALLDDAELELFARMETADGAKMTGFGLIEWAVDPVTLAELAEPDETYGDTRIVRPFDVGAGTVAAGEAEWPFSVVTLADVAEVQVFDPGPKLLFEDGDTVAAEQGPALVMHLAAYTQGGRYVFGDGGNLLTVEVADPDIAASIAVDPDNESTEDEALLGPTRGWFIEPRQPGTTEMTVTWGEHTVTVTVDVSPAPSDDTDDAAPDAEGSGNAS